MTLAVLDGVSVKLNSIEVEAALDALSSDLAVTVTDSAAVTPQTPIAVEVTVAYSLAGVTVTDSATVTPQTPIEISVGDVIPTSALPPLDRVYVDDVLAGEDDITRTGSAAITLAVFTSTASGTFATPVTGTGSPELADFLTTTEATHPRVGSAAPQLSDFLADADGIYGAATVAVTLGPFVSDVVATHPRVGTAAVTLAPFTQAASGQFDIVDGAQITLAPFISTASGVTGPPITGSLAQTLPPFTTNGSSPPDTFGVHVPGIQLVPIINEHRLAIPQVPVFNPDDVIISVPRIPVPPIPPNYADDWEDRETPRLPEHEFTPFDPAPLRAFLEQMRGLTMDAFNRLADAVRRQSLNIDTLRDQAIETTAVAVTASPTLVAVSGEGTAPRVAFGDTWSSDTVGTLVLNQESVVIFDAAFSVNGVINDTSYKWVRFRPTPTSVLLPSAIEWREITTNDHSIAHVIPWKFATVLPAGRYSLIAEVLVYQPGASSVVEPVWVMQGYVLAFPKGQGSVTLPINYPTL